MGLISLLKAVKPASGAIFEHNESDAITEQKDCQKLRFQPYNYGISRFKHFKKAIL